MTQRIRIPANDWQPREYQMPLWSYLEGGGREAVAVWNRRAGKDEIALHRACVAAHTRIAGYLHMLPEAAQARKALWDSVNVKTGRRRIDEAFPPEIRETLREHEMFIKFKSGSTWQLCGSDNYNSLVGSGHAGIVYSEWPLAKPSASAFLSPIIAENNGWELYLYTPRGRNHGLTTLQAARSTPGSFAQVLTIEDTKVLTPEALERERIKYVKRFGEEQGNAFFRQEWYCDFSAAVLGAILARYVDRAEQEGRINDRVEFDEDGAPIEISSDIGRHDTATWWFWQPKVGGYSIVDYDEDSGLDAQEWIARLDKKLEPYKLEKIWLPPDAKAKTFAAKHSALEQFLDFFGAQRVGMVKPSLKSDRINAARTVISSCEFHGTRCDDGLEGLRNWMYEWNEDLEDFSKEPKHDWASHAGDGFSYGAQVMQERTLPVRKPTPQERHAAAVAAAVARPMTFDEALKRHDQRHEPRRRI